MRHDRQTVGLLIAACYFGDVLRARDTDRNRQTVGGLAHGVLDFLRHRRRRAEERFGAAHVEKGFVETQRLDPCREFPECRHDRPRSLAIQLEARRHDDRMGATAQGLGHRHRAADAVWARLVARREHDAAAALRADENRLAPQGGIVALLDRRIERIHVGMHDRARPSLCHSRRIAVAVVHEMRGQRA